MDSSTPNGNGNGDKGHTTKILAITFVFVLIAFIVIGAGYLLWTKLRTTPTGGGGGPLVTPYFKKFTFEAYSLLPDFQSGQYESRVVVGGVTYPPLNEPGIKWNSTTKTAEPTFDISVAEGMGIQYTMYDTSTQNTVLVADYAVTQDDMKNATVFYLCDGNVVGDQNLIKNFSYRFDGKWSSSNCNTTYAVLSWNTAPLTGSVFSTDDQIPCATLPTKATVPFTYNSTGATPASVGWKGAWVGMQWYVNLGSTGGTGIGSVKVTDPTKPVLVIAPGKLAMSSS